MGQVTIYLDDETEKKLNRIIKDSDVSKSKWIARLIKEKADDAWPSRVREMAGAWQDLPTSGELREGLGSDQEREPL